MTKGETDQGGNAYLDEFDVDDYYIDNGVTRNCIDLIAICHKREGGAV